MSQTDSDLDEQVARLVFRWKWMSWLGMPAKGTPGYPTECRIQAFVSPETLAAPRWLAFLADRELQVASGDEPLHYWYCSSRGPEYPPPYSQSADILVLEEVRNNWPHERGRLFGEALERMWLDRWENTCTPLRGWALYELGDYSRAAIEVLKP